MRRVCYRSPGQWKGFELFTLWSQYEGNVSSAVFACRFKTFTFHVRKFSKPLLWRKTGVHTVTTGCELGRFPTFARLSNSCETCSRIRIVHIIQLLYILCHSACMHNICIYMRYTHIHVYMYSMYNYMYTRIIYLYIYIRLHYIVYVLCIVLYYYIL